MTTTNNKLTIEEVKNFILSLSGCYNKGITIIDGEMVAFDFGTRTVVKFLECSIEDICWYCYELGRIEFNEQQLKQVVSDLNGFIEHEEEIRKECNQITVK